MDRGPTDLIVDYLEAASNGDAAAMSALCGDGFEFDAIHHDARGLSPLNRDGASQFWSGWFRAFSEFDWQVTRAISAEELVVVEWTFVGRQDGPLDGVFWFEAPVSDKVVRFRGASFFECKNGEIVRQTIYVDLATLMVELGISP